MIRKDNIRFLLLNFLIGDERGREDPSYIFLASLLWIKERIEGLRSLCRVPAAWSSGDREGSARNSDSPRAWSENGVAVP
jgi:hypothetical protein